MYLLFDGGGVERRREGLLMSGLETFAALLLQALLALVLADLDHVVLASPATLVSVHCHLVMVAADLGSLVRPQRHGY